MAIWEIEGSLYLKGLSGSYEEKDVYPLLQLALERSESIFDFDSLLSARNEKGDLLSGSQLLAFFEDR
jgi:hypothetical protein